MEKLYAIQICEIISTIRQEGWAFIFICTYLFFEYVRPQNIYPAIDVIPFVPIILFLTLISLLSGSNLRAHPNLLNKLIVFYALVVLFSSAFSQYPSISFSKWRIFFDWFIIYFLIVSIVHNEKRFFIFLLSFLLYSFKMSQHGFLSWQKRGFAYEGWGITGAPGWFNNSGEVGIQMCIFIPIAVSFIIAAYPYMNKFWFSFFLLMPLTGIGTVVASSSRGAVLGLGFAGTWSILRNPKIFLFGAILLLITSFIVVHILPEEFEQRFHSSGSDRTSLIRIERWGHGIETMNQYPLFGVGFKAWEIFYKNHFNPEIEGSYLVHNIFVECGSELGYAGLTVFGAIVLTCFFTTRKVRILCRDQKDRFLVTISYGFDAALVGFLVSSFFVTVLYYPFFWIHCALTTCLHNAAKNKLITTKFI